MAESLGDILEKGKAIAAARAPTCQPCEACGKPAVYRTCHECSALEMAKHNMRRKVSATLASIPDRYQWARLAAQELAGRISRPEAARMAKESIDAPAWLLRGPAGCGKTSLASAILVARSEHTGLQGAFVDCFKLATARAHQALGEGESPLVERAMRVDLLLLDDLGSERMTPHNCVADVLFERHQYNRPTIVTTWLADKAIAERYGDGIARRVLEGAVVIELGEGSSR